MKKYCFDSSAFINSWRIYHPPKIKIFTPIWVKIAELMNEGRIIMPREAEKEIFAGNDDLKNWLKAHTNKKYVRPYDSAQIDLATEIVNKYPLVSQYRKPTRPHHADPFIVALAKIEDAIVVTWEGPNGSKDNPAIPDLCKEYGIKECCNMVGFIAKEKLSLES